MSVKANQEKLRVMLSQVEKMNVDDSAIAEVKVAAAENGAETSTTKAAPPGEKTGEDDEEEEEETDNVAVPSNIPAPPPLPPVLGELGTG